MASRVIRSNFESRATQHMDIYTNNIISISNFPQTVGLDQYSGVHFCHSGYTTLSFYSHQWENKVILDIPIHDLARLKSQLYLIEPK